MRKRLLTILLASGIVLAGCSMLTGQKPKSAPQVTARTLDGQTFSLAEQKGKVVLVQFWATWCKYSKQLEPRLKNIHRKFGPRDDFVMVGVALDNDAQTVKTYCIDNDITWPQLHEPTQAKNTLIGAFGIRHIPSARLIHKDGSIEQFTLNRNQIKNALLKKPIVQVYLEEQIIGAELLSW